MGNNNWLIFWSPLFSFFSFFLDRGCSYLTPLTSNFLPYQLAESEVAQWDPALCDPLDCSLPGSSVHGIFQARILEWVVIYFSRGSAQPRDQTQVFRVAGRCSATRATKKARYANLLYDHKGGCGYHFPHLLSQYPHNEAVFPPVAWLPMKAEPLPQSHSVPFSPHSEPTSVSPFLLSCAFLAIYFFVFFFLVLILLIPAHSYCFSFLVRLFVTP